MVANVPEKSEEVFVGARAAGFEGVTSTAAEYPGGKGIASAAVVAYKGSR
jgi:hypothetical protein